jgi:hypothetical protein
MSFGKILKKVIVDRHVKKLYKSLSNDPVIKDIAIKKKKCGVNLQLLCRLIISY